MSNRRRAATLAVVLGCAGTLVLPLAPAGAATPEPVTAPATDAGPAGAASSTPDALVPVSYLVEQEGGALRAVSTPPMPATEAAQLVSTLARRPDVVTAGLGATFRRSGTVVRSATLDPLAGKQWALQAVGAASAWKYTRGKGVLVAVVDDGVDATHPDLRRAVVDGRNMLSPGAPVSPGYHGTHVSGIIAATAGNGIGTAGLAPRVRVLPVDVFAGESTTDVAVANGIIYAVRRGANVINLSLGGPDGTRVLRRSIDFALRNGVTVVAAAGNEGEPMPEYPASYPGVIGVGAVDSALRLATFSNTGPHVDLVAPGVSILSTRSGGGYVRMSGTSMATPYVTAAAALLKAQFPAWTPAQIGAELGRTATDLGPRGADPFFGSGLVHPDRALAGTPGAPRTTTLVSTLTQGSGRSKVRVGWTAPVSVGGYGVASYRVELSANGGVSWQPGTTVSAGTRSMEIDVAPGRLVRARVVAVARRTGTVGPATTSRIVWHGVDAPDSREDARRLDDLDVAHPVLPTISEVLSSSADHDWYRVRLPEGGELTASLLDSQPGMRMEIVADDHATPVVPLWSIDDGGATPRLSLSSGEYLVHVFTLGPVDRLRPYRLDLSLS